MTAKAVVDTVWVGSEPNDAGGSCADPDFSTHGNSMDLALAAAINAVDTDGDTIIICNGTYRYDSSIAEISLEYDFYIVAEEGGEVTLDGAGRFGLLSVAHPESTLLVAGIRFINASDTGAIYRPEGDLLVIESEFIRNNKVDEAGEDGFGGGAINGDLHCDDLFEVHDSIFTSNSGPTGAVSTCSVVVSGSTFTNNSSSAYGGALYVCDLDLTDSTFRRNTAKGDGGAVSACAIMALEGNSFERNVARGAGGAIWVSEPMSLENPWTNNTFRANRARAGGGIYFGCRPPDSRRVSASLRTENVFAQFPWSAVEFERERCGRG
jgi:predicted outer membrane repeat protein